MRTRRPESTYKDLGFEGKEMEFEVWQTMLEARRLLYLIERQAVEHLNYFGDEQVDAQDVQDTAETITILCRSWDLETKNFLEHNGLEYFETNMKRIADEMDAKESEA